MPNTLVHFGIQGIATRIILREADYKWIFTGAILPDIPWILKRAVTMIVSGVDPIDLRLYAIAQSSLAGCLFLAGALAIFSRRPWRVFSILVLNSLIHLLLDACQIKWGGGVNVFAPFSWKLWNFGFFWPENWPTYMITFLGLIYITAIWFRRSWDESIGLRRPKFRSIFYAALFLACYYAMPFAFMNAIESANVSYTATLRNPCLKCPVAFDRAFFRIENDKDILKTRSGLRYRIEGKRLNYEATVSVRGIFQNPSTIRIDELYEHKGVSRDIPTYVGLAIFILIWVRSLWSRTKEDSS